MDVILDSAADAVNEAPCHRGYFPKEVFLARRSSGVAAGGSAFAGDFALFEVSSSQAS